jgi:hypothetical protein
LKGLNEGLERFEPVFQKDHAVESAALGVNVEMISDNVFT